ncbi:MAG: hypothetical protein ACRDQU_21765 [Pseudonocardiaceae bacterium]
MGAAEVGRELGDTGGPLLVAGVATALTLPGGLLALAAVLAAAAAITARTHRPEQQPTTPLGEPSDAAAPGTQR